MERTLRVLMVSSEAVPFAKTGGLADVVGALPYWLASLECEVRCFLPRYRQVDKTERRLEPLLDTRPTEFAGARIGWSVLGAPADSGVTWTFLDAPAYFDREYLYSAYGQDYPDSCERFAFFCQAALAACRILDWKPDIIHCHDWQSGLIPAYLKLATRTPLIDTHDPFYAGIGTLLTVHNIAYQGLFEKEILGVLGFPEEHFTLDKLEYWGKLNFLKAGLVFADRVNTVSKRYAEEIQTEAFGRGLQGVLQWRARDLSGILNGIDGDAWNPELDPHIAARYSADDLTGKAACRQALEYELGLQSRADAPLVGIISRLDAQKGFDLIEAAFPRIMASGIRLAVLGTGAPKYHAMLTSMAQRYPGQVSATLAFDNALAHRIEAGADVFLMPSKFEPCGLNQMYSLRYGTVPVVHATGGLADTVENYDGRRSVGNGFVFQDYTSYALMTALRRSVKYFADRQRWESLMKIGMRQDFSWTKSAAAYLELYRAIARR